MSARETLPPTEPEVPLPKSGSGSAKDQLTLPVDPDVHSQARREETSRQPPASQAVHRARRDDDRTVLVGEEEVRPVLAWLVITAGGPVGSCSR